MTNQEFLDKFYLDYDKVSNGSAPGYQVAEISNIASQAQEDLIIKKYGSLSNRLREGFEESEKRIQELGELVTVAILTPAAYDATKNVDNGVFVTLPNTLLASATDFSNVFWLPIYEKVTTNKLDCSILYNTTIYKKAKVIPVSHQAFDSYMDDPFNRPNENKVLRLRYSGNKHELVTNGKFTITSYYVRYIKKPVPINLAAAGGSAVSAVSDLLQREILEETVMRAFKTIQATQQLQIETQTPKE